jgi:homoserine O-acetyltransferase
MNDADPKSSGNIPGEFGLVAPRDYRCLEPFLFDSGASISEFTLRYETYGTLASDRANAILICHALSGDHHCAGINTLQDRKQGWWNNLIGPGKPIDTNRFFVVCSNCLGGCQGSTGPASTNPETGRPYNLGFPVLTIRDFVRAQKRLLDHLGIEELFCVVGGSMGGMQVLQWAIEYPATVKRILPLATSARQSVQAIAFNEVGRCAIVQDPAWNGGDYTAGAGPNVGLAVARMMAHITYLSDKGLEAKFGRNKRSGGEAREIFDVEFEVESYLRYQGESFTNRFDANTYLYFSKALDHFDLYGENGRLEDAFAPVEARTLAIGFTSDWLFPPEHNQDIVHALLRSGKRAAYAELDMDLGHDSFLVQSPALYDLFRAFLASE